MRDGQHLMQMYCMKLHQRQRGKQKVPGAEKSYIVYDEWDRPFLTQDANMKADNQWTFTKYDIQGRPVYSGIYTNTTATTRVAMQSLVDGIDYNTDPHYESQ